MRPPQYEDYTHPLPLAFLTTTRYLYKIIYQDT